MSRVCWEAVDEKLQSSTCRAFRIKLRLTMLCATWESSLLVTYRTMQTSSKHLLREEEQWKNIAARWMCFLEGTCNTIHMYTYYLLTSGCCCILVSSWASLVPIFPSTWEWVYTILRHYPRGGVWWYSADPLGYIKLMASHCRSARRVYTARMMTQHLLPIVCTVNYEKSEELLMSPDPDPLLFGGVWGRDQLHVCSSHAGGGANVPWEWPHSHQWTDGSSGCEHKGAVHGQRGRRKGESPWLSRGNRTTHSYSL